MDYKAMVQRLIEAGMSPKKAAELVSITYMISKKDLRSAT